MPALCCTLCCIVCCTSHCTLYCSISCTVCFNMSCTLCCTNPSVILCLKNLILVNIPQFFSIFLIFSQFFSIFLNISLFYLLCNSCGWTIISLFSMPPPPDLENGHENVAITVNTNMFVLFYFILFYFIST